MGLNFLRIFPEIIQNLHGDKINQKKPRLMQ